MAFIADVLSFIRETVNGQQTPRVKVDQGGENTSTPGHFADAGDDSQPLPTDVAVCVDGPGSGSAQVVGYQDPTSAPKAGAGEKRIYSRSGPGVVACEVWLKSNGELVIENAAGIITLATDGTVDINGAVIDLAGNVTTALQISLDTHTHPTPFGPTGPPLPG